MVSASAVRDLLANRPDLVPVVEQALEADEPFTFDELDVDPGRFGEVVDAGIVEKTGGGYVVANRQTVARGLGTDLGSENTERRVDLSLPAFDPTVLAALGGAVAFVVVLRVVALPDVFRDGAVVLSSNDPYFYRYWVEQLLLDATTSLGTLPSGVTAGEPLTIATLWLVAELFGGTTTAAGWVLAWYPIVAAIVTSLLLYLLTVETTSDRRIGLAAVAMLAVIPGHAVRTSVGFADHHAFDYPLLVATALALVVLVGTDQRPRRTLLGAVGLGVGVAAQTLAWNAGPLLLLPIGLVLVGRAVFAVRDHESPARTLAPVLAGLALGAAVVLLVHVGLGWHSRSVALAPALLFVGGVAVAGVAEAGRRYELAPRYVLAGIVATGVGGLGLVAVALPAFWNAAISSLSGQLFLSVQITETKSLFAASVGWLPVFGLLLGLAIPYLGWGTVKLSADTRWLVPVAYGWYLLALAAIQVRFVGELAAFMALFAGLGFVHIADRIEVARPPVPFVGSEPIRSVAIPARDDLGHLILLFLLISGLGMVLTPIQVGSVTTPEEQYQTAVWMADYSEERGWEYPDNYVFSRWDQNRRYNYVVNGESRSYRFAERRYAPFVSSADAEGFYERNRDRVGFVVYSDAGGRPGAVGRALAAYGSRTDDAEGLQHYRGVHVSGNATYRVFVLVPGATLIGTAEPDTVLTLQSEQTLGERTFTYERRIRTDSDGHYLVTVPYPGEYTVDGTSVLVPERAVNSGENVSVVG